MPSPYARAPFPKETNLAELYHENTKIPPYAREAEEDPTGALAEYPPAEGLAYAPHARLALPPPAPVRAPLEDVVRARRSRRAFADAPLRLDELSALLHLASGVTGALASGEPVRAAPSAGARFPLELFPVALRVDGLAAGVHHYVPDAHALEPVGGAWSPDALRRALFDQPFLERASLVLLVGAVFPRTLVKYRERGYRLVLLEAGHAMQNLLLAAEGLGLAATTLGGFVDDELNAMCGLNGIDENVLYAAALGRPA